jgi:integrase
MELAKILELPSPKTDGRGQLDKKRNPRGVFEKVKGSGIWWVRHVDADGQLRRERVGSKRAAIDLYYDRKADAGKGKKLPKNLRKRAVTFQDIALDAIADIKLRYRVPSYDVERLKAAISWFGNKDASSLKGGIINARLMMVAVEKKWAASTINHHRSVISLAYRLAMRDGKLEYNPARDVPHKREANDRTRCLSSEEERDLRAVIRDRFPEHEIELDFALNTGLRQGSQFGLTWNMVNFQQKTLRIPRTKNDRPLELPLNDCALEILRGLRLEARHSQRVFISRQTGRALNYPKHWFSKAVRAAGILDFRWHDLRHTFATRLRRNDVPLEDIGDLLGHESLAMTQRYARADFEHLRVAVNKIQPIDTSTDTGIARTKPGGA